MAINPDLDYLEGLNFQKNKADSKLPDLPKDKHGVIGDRDPNTGNYEANLFDGGQYQAKKLFNSSPSKSTQVQLNPVTKTVDYRGNQNLMTDEDKTLFSSLNPTDTGLGDELLKGIIFSDVVIPTEGGEPTEGDDVPVYPACSGQTIRWRRKSDLKLRTVSRCNGLSYKITQEPLGRTTGFGGSDNYGILEYEGNVNRTFSVSSSGGISASPSTAIAFQIYAPRSDAGRSGCVKNIVAVSASGNFGFSGAVGNLSYDLVATVACGQFSISLNPPPTVPVLYVFNSVGTVIGATEDFIEASIGVYNFQN